MILMTTNDGTVTQKYCSHILLILMIWPFILGETCDSMTECQRIFPQILDGYGSAVRGSASPKFQRNTHKFSIPCWRNYGNIIIKQLFYSFSIDRNSPWYDRFLTTHFALSNQDGWLDILVYTRSFWAIYSFLSPYAGLSKVLISTKNRSWAKYPLFSERIKPFLWHHSSSNSLFPSIGENLFAFIAVLGHLLVCLLQQYALFQDLLSFKPALYSNL